MNKKPLFLLLICSVALNFGFAGVYGFSMMNRPKATTPKDCPFTSEYTRLYAMLGLDKTQLERIEPLDREFHEKVATIGGKIMEQRDNLMDALAQETVDRAAIEAIHRDMAVRQSEMQRLVVSHILDMKQVMNPEQRDRFFASMRRSFGAQNFMNHAN